MKSCLCKNIHKFFLALVAINVQFSEPLQLTVGDACIERCSTKISWRWRSWCSINCSLKSLKLPSTSFVPAVTRIRKSTFKSNEFRPKPDWEKITADPGTDRTSKSTTQTKMTFPLKTTFTVTTTKETITPSALKTTDKITTTLSTSKRKTYVYPDFGTGNKDELERVIQDNIDTQNMFFKLAGGLLGLCLVVFVAFFVFRSMKKPHRVSFTDDPVFVAHTDLARYA